MRSLMDLGREGDMQEITSLEAIKHTHSPEVLKAWIDPSRKDPRTIHHRGKGMFMIDGRSIRLASRMK
jgi:hypothetical protein